ncbi:MAG: hypothetical protein V4555_00350 [Acidobacteriota bacterium]
MISTPRTPIALDTNLLLLWLVGRTDPSLLHQHKRVSQFQRRDLQRLEDMTELCSGFVTTPHVLTETNNFLDHGAKHRREDLLTTFSRYIDVAEEVREPARLLCRQSSFRQFGLSDAGLLTLSTRCAILTDDFRLAQFILNKGGMAQSFLRSPLS